MSLIKKITAKNLNKSIEKIQMDLKEKEYTDKLSVQNDSNFYLVIVFESEKEKLDFMKSKKIKLDKEFIYKDEI